MDVERRPQAGRAGADDLLPERPFPPDWLFFHAARTPGAPAVASATVRLSYDELAGRVRLLAGHLAAGGSGSGAASCSRSPTPRPRWWQAWR